ncbi:MAG: nitrogen fixation protein [Thiohalocapsa sp.]|nr:nitrogen fixation protein [Thiohalocapsa sp.]
MRVAVTSQNFRSITGHAGKSRRFVIFEWQEGSKPAEIERLDLPKDMSLHEYHGEDHPLYRLSLDAIITGGAGEHFVQRMARQGIAVLATGETDIAAAVDAVAAGRPLPPAAPHEHGHDHTHVHLDNQ